MRNSKKGDAYMNVQQINQDGVEGRLEVDSQIGMIQVLEDLGRMQIVTQKNRYCPHCDEESPLPLHTETSNCLRVSVSIIPRFCTLAIVSDSGNGEKSFTKSTIRFCPMCGRNLVLRKN